MKKTKQPRLWKTLERHPLSAEYPDLSAVDFAQTRCDLKQFGIINARKVILCDGMVLDGWQFLQACIAEGIKPEFEELRKGIEPEDFVRMANDNRRHETQAARETRAETRRGRVAKGAEEGKSTRQMAEEEKVSQPTIINDIKAIEKSTASGDKGLSPEHDENQGASAPNGQKVTGRDGKTYSAKKPTPQAVPPKKCDRCTKLNLNRTDCPACEALQSNKKNGQPLFDDRAFQKSIDEVMRGVRDRTAVYGNSNAAGIMYDRANSLLLAWQAWQKEPAGRR